MAKNIFIAAHPRSGSTYLCRLLEKFDQIGVFLEIFHTNPTIIKQHLRGKYSSIAEQLSLPKDDKQLRGTLLNKSSCYIKTLGSLNDEEFVAFKVFPGHIPSEHLEEVIASISCLDIPNLSIESA